MSERAGPDVPPSGLPPSGRLPTRPSSAAPIGRRAESWPAGDRPVRTRGLRRQRRVGYPNGSDPTGSDPTGSHLTGGRVGDASGAAPRRLVDGPGVDGPGVDGPSVEPNGPACTEAAPELPLLGDAVRGAREAAGMTLEQVSSRTKIRVAVLRDLEAGSTERSGGAAYARGHLRAVAAVTGAEPAVLLAAHERAGGGQPPPLVPPVAARPARSVHRTRSARPTPPMGAAALALPVATAERSGPRWGVAVAGAAAVLIVLMLVGLWSRDGSSARLQPTASPSSTPVVASVAPAPAPGAALRIQVTGSPSWVSVRTAAGTPLYAGVLPAGTVREWTDPGRLQVVVGNAGVVTVSCSGPPAKAGDRGQVRRYTCSPTGLAPA